MGDVIPAEAGIYPVAIASEARQYGWRIGMSMEMSFLSEAKNLTALKSSCSRDPSVVIAPRNEWYSQGKTL